MIILILILGIEAKTVSLSSEKLACCSLSASALINSLSIDRTHPAIHTFKSPEYSCHIQII